MKKYFEIDIVYFTEFKSDFEKKDEHRFIVPTRYKTSLLKELKSNSIDIDSYDFVIIRNDMDILKHAIEQRDKHNFKVGLDTYTTTISNVKISFLNLKLRNRKSWII